MNIIFKNDCIVNDATKERYNYIEIDAKKLYILINAIIKEKENINFMLEGNEPIAQRMFDIFNNEFKEKDNIV